MSDAHPLDQLADVYCRKGIDGEELASALESLGWLSTEDVEVMADELRRLGWTVVAPEDERNAPG